MKAAPAVTEHPIPLSPRSRFRAAMILAMAADALQIVVFPLFAEGALSPADDVLDLAVAAVLVRVRQRMRAEIPSASRVVEPRRLQPRDRARHRRVTKRLRQTMETQQFEVHRPPWPESWQLENASVARAELGPQFSWRLLSYCCFEFSLACIPVGVWRPAGTGKTLR